MNSNSVTGRPTLCIGLMKTLASRGLAVFLQRRSNWYSVKDSMNNIA